jgi:STAS domain
VLDFEGVTMMDSAGIGLICGKHLALKKENKKLAICYVSQSIFRVMMVAKVDNVLNIYPDLSSALSDLKTSDVGIASTQINLSFLGDSPQKMPDFKMFHQEKKKKEDEEKAEQNKHKPKEFWEKK